jgi:hypothetical protein
MVASEAQFQSLVAQRQSKVYEILKWKQQWVSVDYVRTEQVQLMGPISHSEVLRVVECNQFYVTLSSTPVGMLSKPDTCLPLNRVHLSFDVGNNRLKLEVLPF